MDSAVHEDVDAAEAAHWLAGVVSIGVPMQGGSQLTGCLHIAGWVSVLGQLSAQLSTSLKPCSVAHALGGSGAKPWCVSMEPPASNIFSSSSLPSSLFFSSSP